MQEDYSGLRAKHLAMKEKYTALKELKERGDFKIEALLSQIAALQQQQQSNKSKSQSQYQGPEKASSQQMFMSPSPIPNNEHFEEEEQVLEKLDMD